MTSWTNLGAAGYLPQIFLEDDPHTAQEQANLRYAHGGGWNSFEGFKLINHQDGKFNLQYPGDIPMIELARTKFHDQTLVLFQSSWVGIIDSKGLLVDVARLD